MELEHLRQGLASIDHKIVECFLKRMELVNQVAEYKVDTKGRVHVPEQEERVIAKIRAQVPLELESSANVLWRTLMRISRERQYERLIEQDLNWQLGKDLKAASDDLIQAREVAIPRNFAHCCTQKIRDVYPNSSLMEVASSRDACLQVVGGLADVAILPTGQEMFSLLEKHALFIQACLGFTNSGERVMAVGPKLTLARAATQVSILIHTGDDLECLHRVLGTLSDLGLSIFRLEPVGDAGYYLEFQTELRSTETIRALYQIEHETPKMHFFGWY